MCKILVITKPLTKAQVLGLIHRTAKRFAVSQRDGFGFACFDREGNLTARGRYFSSRRYTDAYRGWGNRHPSFIAKKEEGEIEPITYTLMIHGRTSTNVLGVDYCHPFKEDDTYLVHNGILDWRGPEKHRPEHKNDSGRFLEWLVREEHPEPVDWTSYWAGYAALAIMRPGKGLHVVKCAQARLTITPATVKGYILATDARDVPRKMRKAGATTEHLEAVELVFDLEGNLRKDMKFKGFKARTWDARATRSLGTQSTAYKPMPLYTGQNSFNWADDADLYEEEDEEGMTLPKSPRLDALTEAVRVRHLDLTKSAIPTGGKVTENEKVKATIKQVGSGRCFVEVVHKNRPKAPPRHFVYDTYREATQKVDALLASYR